MKIGIAQTRAIKGDVPKNIQTHQRIIALAAASDADLVVFPELSLTGYEPELAEALAIHWDDRNFDPFQTLADRHEITIGAGMPTRAANGINISMLIFQPHKARVLYSKRLLHADELPYFVSGQDQPFLHIKGKKVGIGICYETLQREHFVHAVAQQADLFIASVAKPDRGLAKAYIHFPSIAKEFEIPILMSNCVGYCDNFLSNGQSAIWNHEGKLIQQLDEKNQGLLIYDTASDGAVSLQLDALSHEG